MNPNPDSRLTSIVKVVRLSSSSFFTENLWRQKYGKFLFYRCGRVEKEAELTGYKLGLTTEPGYASKNDGLFALKRIRVSPGFDKESFGNYLTSSNQYANN